MTLLGRIPRFRPGAMVVLCLLAVGAVAVGCGGNAAPEDVAIGPDAGASYQGVAEISRKREGVSTEPVDVEVARDGIPLLIVVELASESWYAEATLTPPGASEPVVRSGGTTIALYVPEAAGGLWTLEVGEVRTVIEEGPPAESEPADLRAGNTVFTATPQRVGEVTEDNLIGRWVAAGPEVENVNSPRLGVMGRAGFGSYLPPVDGWWAQLNADGTWNFARGGDPMLEPPDDPTWQFNEGVDTVTLRFEGIKEGEPELIARQHYPLDVAMWGDRLLVHAPHDPEPGVVADTVVYEKR